MLRTAILTFIASIPGVMVAASMVAAIAFLQKEGAYTYVTV
ncbi:hypothetical protein [Acidicapsa acidisoli]|nr:hypothetical protein [Acidicapsa acidisoli]